jgi:4-azaleucine resistance transporter AzlC
MTLLKKLPAAIKAAFPHTIPVLTGFLFFGMAYGILMSSRGFGWYWVLLTSIVVFAGALQFVGISLLTSVFDPLCAFLIALSVNARHLIYGISMLEKYSGTGKIKPYLIYAMCDETFSIIYSTDPPPHVDRRAFMLAVTLLNQVYWVLGGVIGGLIGPFLTFNMHGIDFVMTAFFVVIFLNQWHAQKKHAPALIGLGASAVSLLMFGADTFIIPAMILIVACLTIFRARLAKGVED